VPWDERVQPVDFYAGGLEHVQRHHLYARFVTMALHDMGRVPFDEPFTTVRLGGLLNLAGGKMSKSRGNVVSPDDYADLAPDVLRLALLFTTTASTGPSRPYRRLNGSRGPWRT
jgi:leucyl-tRNA synthetase